MTNDLASRFREAMEAEDCDRLRPLLAPDLRFASAVVHGLERGRDGVLRMTEVMFSVFEDRRYEWELGDERRHVFCFSARVGDRELEGIEVIESADGAVIDEMAVMLRPLSGVVATERAITAELERLASF